MRPYDALRSLANSDDKRKSAELRQIVLEGLRAGQLEAYAILPSSGLKLTLRPIFWTLETSDLFRIATSFSKPSYGAYLRDADVFVDDIVSWIQKQEAEPPRT